MEFSMHMPGAFQTTLQSLPDPAILSPYSSIHSPNPSAFSSNMRKPSQPRPHTGSYTNTISGSRKRARLDSTDSDNHPVPRFTSAADCARIFAADTISDCPSPAPLVNIDYKLAGGLDQEGIRLQQKEEDDTRYDYEQDYRPSRYFRTTSSSTPKDVKQLQSEQRSGWSSAVWAVTGGVAGKVFNFCFKTAFRGFYAGGGQGYQLRTNLPEIVSPVWTVVSQPQDMGDDSPYDTPSVPTLVTSPLESSCPGDYFSTKPQFPGIQNASRSSSNATTPTMRRGWVMVDPLDHDDSDHSPVRKKSRASVAGLQNRADSSSMAKLSPIVGRPKLARSHSSIGSSGRVSTTEASYASPRSRKRDSDRTMLDRTHGKKRGLTARTSMPVIPPTKQVNDSSMFMGSEPQPFHVTPRKQDDNLIVLSDKIRKRERQQDASIQRLNRQLRDMIREGQQALASRVEVEMEEYNDDHDDDDETINDNEDYEAYTEGEHDYEKNNAKLFGGGNVCSTAHSRPRIDAAWRYSPCAY